MAKKGKKKQPQKRLTFKDIIQRYKSQDYKGASHHLSRIYLQPHERQDAKAMGADLLHREAYDHFENHRYQEVTALITAPSAGEIADDNAIVCAALKGLSHLYLGEWKQAAACLAPSGNQELTRKFSFYYLLALLYDGSCEDFDAFLDAQKVSPETLGARAGYLRMAFHIRRGEWLQASALLDGMERLSDSHRNNLLALQHILSGEPPAEKPDASQVFPLYKVLLSIPLQETEMAYFSKMQALSPLMELLEKQKNRHLLKRLLRNLCEDGLVLPEKDLLFCLAHSPEEMRPYIAYNQIAAMYSGDLEDCIKDINRLMDKHAQWFFQVPESIYIYLKAVMFNENLHKVATILERTDAWLGRFSRLATPAQLDDLAWLVSDLLLKTPVMGMERDISLRKIEKWVKALPDVIPFKYLLIADYCTYPEATKQPSVAMDLFALPRTQEHQERLITEFRQMLTLLAPSMLDEVFGNMSKTLRKESDKQFVLMYAKFQEQVLASIRLHPPVLKNTVVLDLLKLLSEHHGKMTLKLGIPLSPNLQKDLQAAFAGMLTHFGKDESDPEYGESYSGLANREKQMELSAMLDKAKSPKDAIQIYKTMVLNGGADKCTANFINILEEQHFPAHLAAPVGDFMQVLSVHAITDAEKISADFFERYNELKAPDTCDCGDNLLLDIVEYMGPKLNGSICGCRVLYQAGLACGDLLTKNPDSQGLNRANSFLSDLKWLMEKDETFQPEKPFVFELLDFAAGNGKKKSSQSVAEKRAFFMERL